MQLRDFWRVAGFLIIGLTVGFMVSRPSWGLCGGALAYIFSVHSDLNRLLGWLRKRKIHEPPEYPGVFEDLTLEIDYLRERHKRRKKRLSSYLKQFQQATRALPDATVVLDTEDEVRWANDAARRTLGVRWPDDVGQRITNLIRQPELREFIEARAHSEHATVEIESPTDRDRHLSLLTAPYGNDQRILVARDVTQLHRANQIRRDFVANVSHELRTPITVFRGFLENLTAQTDVCPPAWRPVLEQMTIHSDRMRGLVEELLLLSSLETGELVPHPVVVDVARLITEIHAAARELSGDREHLFSLEIDSELYLNGSRDELYSAFSNLVFNAIHYTDARGIIRIRWFRDDDGAHFVVEDNGIGIGEEHIARITERFYRVDSARQRRIGGTGTGLGLAIAKHVLSRHNARLSITSTLGSGSRFSADFPAGEVRSGSDTNDNRVRNTA